jgi:hypothetical protein
VETLRSKGWASFREWSVLSRGTRGLADRRPWFALRRHRTRIEA